MSGRRLMSSRPVLRTLLPKRGTAHRSVPKTRMRGSQTPRPFASCPVWALTQQLNLFLVAAGPLRADLESTYEFIGQAFSKAVDTCSVPQPFFLS